MNEFLVEDEKDKEYTYKIYVDMEDIQSRQKAEQAEAFLKEDRLTTSWQLANNNRKRIERLEKEVRQIWTLVIAGAITVTLFVILVVLTREGII